MKKVISLSVLAISGLLFIWLWYYGKSASYDYHIADFIEYIFYWSVALFILSLFAFVLNDKKYKVWFFITILFMFVFVLFAYNTGEHDALFSGDYVNFWFISLYSFISIIYFIVQFIKKPKIK